MADELPPDQPPSDTPRDKDAQLVDEKELDDMLSQAADLTTELSGEVGAPDTSAAATERRGEPGGEAESPQDLETELKELQQLIAETGSELGADDVSSPEQVPLPEASAESPDASQPLPGRNAAPGSTTESARPEAPAGPVSSPSDSPGASPATPSKTESTPSDDNADEAERVRMPRPGVVGTGMVGALGTPPPKPPTPQPEKRDEPTEPDTATSHGEQRSSLLSGIADILRTLAARLSPHAFIACEHAVNVLVKIDRPFARLGVTVRRIIGWIAVATVGTSMIVYLISLF